MGLGEVGAQWLTVVVVGLFAIASPGPDLLVTLRSSFIGSSRGGMYTALGIGVGLCFHTGYSLVGLALLISQSIVLFNLLKLAGAAYLIYVGFRSLRAKPGSLSAVGSGTDEAPRRLTSRDAFTAGLLTNVTNPKVTLFFLALFTQVIDPETSIALKALYGATIVSISTLWFGFLAVVVGQKRGQAAGRDCWALGRTRCRRDVHRPRDAAGVLSRLRVEDTRNPESVRRRSSRPRRHAAGLPDAKNRS